MSGARTRRVIIELHLRDGEPTMETVRKVLDGTGVNLDPNYGPYLIDPNDRTYVVRGEATEE